MVNHRAPPPGAFASIGLLSLDQVYRPQFMVHVPIASCLLANDVSSRRKIVCLRNSSSFCHWLPCSPRAPVTKSPPALQAPAPAQRPAPVPGRRFLLTQPARTPRPVLEQPRVPVLPCPEQLPR